MKFFNKHVLTHAAIVLAANMILYYSLFQLSGNAGNNIMIGMCVASYIVTIILSTVFNSRHDQYQGYFGFNYHLVTYLVTCGLFALMIALNILGTENLKSLWVMIGCWGIGLLVHFLMLVFMFRKRRIKDYDRNEIFN